MMAALIAGERDPKVLAELARARMRAKIPQLEEAFAGLGWAPSTTITGSCWPGCWPAIDAIDADIAVARRPDRGPAGPFR